MKTIEDLPFLKAQAADLERMIRIAPPSAVIAKFQYEEQVSNVREEIARLEEATKNPESKLEDSIQNKHLRRVLKACHLVTTKQLQTLTSDEFEPLHIPSIRNNLLNNQHAHELVEASLLEVSGASHHLVISLSGWKTMLSTCIHQLEESTSDVWISRDHPLYELVYGDLVEQLKDVREELARECNTPDFSLTFCTSHSG